MYEQSILLVLVILGGLILKFSLKFYIYYMEKCQPATMKTFFSSRTRKAAETSRLFLLTVQTSFSCIPGLSAMNIKKVLLAYSSIKLSISKVP